MTMSQYIRALGVSGNRSAERLAAFCEGIIKGLTGNPAFSPPRACAHKANSKKKRHGLQGFKLKSVHSVAAFNAFQSERLIVMPFQALSIFCRA
jgi:hypothetical protein